MSEDPSANQFELLMDLAVNMIASRYERSG